LTDTMSGWWNW